MLIAAWNAAAYLGDAIASVLQQGSGIRWELLIADDGSGDGTGDVAAAYARQFPECIRVLHHPGRENRGISASRNLLLRHACAPILALLDADDVWLPGKLEAQVRLLQRLPGVAMVYAQAERWHDFDLPYCPERGSLGRNFVPPLLGRGGRAGVIEPPQLLEWFLEDESLAPCTCTVLVRTEAARRVGGFCNEFPGLYDDQVFYAKLALRERIAVTTECVARYRQHPRSCCAVAREHDTAQATRAQFLRWLQAYKGAPSRPAAEVLAGASATRVEAPAAELSLV